MSKKIDLTGKRFGRLVVVKELGHKKNGHKMCLCSCDCGIALEVRRSSLLENNTKSCGCLKLDVLKNKERTTFTDLKGIEFGRLTAIIRTKERSSDGSSMWECICCCGNTALVGASHLTSGAIQSCGCLYEDFIQNDCVDETRLTTLYAAKPKNNTSGVKGISWSNTKKKWEAYITFQGVRHHLGYFSNLEYATKARKEAEEKYFTPILEKYGRLEEKP